MTRTLERGSGGRCTFGGGGWQSVKQGRTVGGGSGMGSPARGLAREGERKMARPSKVVPVAI
jgi:hypothetical protein